MSIVPTQHSFGDFGYGTTDEERYAAYPDRARRVALRGVVFSHPWNSSAIGTFDSPHQRPLMVEMAKNFCVTASDLGIQSGNGHNTWGNAMGVQRIHQERDYLINTLGCDSKIIVIGMSHGGASAFAYARDYPANVAAVIGIEPAMSLASLRGITTGLRDSIDASHGTYSAAVHNANSPMMYANLIPDSIPVGIWYAEDDTIIEPSTVLAFKAARPATQLFSINGLVAGNQNGDPVGTSPAVDHTDTAVTQCRPHLTRWALQYAIPN